jgi:hypothetical protein
MASDGHRRFCVRAESGPHPNPPETSDRPEVEGTEWGILTQYADVKDLCRIHNRLGLSGRCMTPDTSVSPLSLGERAGVRVLLILRQPEPSTPASTPPTISQSPADPVAAALLRPCSLPCYEFGRVSLAKSCSSLEGFREKKIRPTAQRKIAFLFLPGKPTR